MKQYPDAILKIFYKHNGVTKVEEQGKFFYLYDKPVFLADMTPAKWWHKFKGYSISRRILDAFSEAKLRPLIIYRLKKQGILYYTTPSKFKDKGILVPYGGHSQFILPIDQWETKQGSIPNEPFGVPILEVSKWLKPQPNYTFEDGPEGAVVYVEE